MEGKYSEIVWLPMGRIASTSTNADALTGLPNTYDGRKLIVRPLRPRRRLGLSSDFSELREGVPSAQCFAKLLIMVATNIMGQATRGMISKETLKRAGWRLSAQKATSRIGST